MPKIDPSLYLYNQENKRTPSPELGKDEFLKILLTQLQHQDPLDPMDDKEFVSQMASFSSLEQMVQMSSSIDRFVENQQMSPIIQHSHIIGKEVTYQGDDEDVDKTSVVIAVTQRDGAVILKLENDDEVDANEITLVRDLNNGEGSE